MVPPIIYHVDVNSAFLSWEAADRIAHDPDALDLRDIPSAIGGDKEKRHGIILAKSAPARAYHIRTGEPIVRALEKCPGLTVVSPRFDIYVTYSNALMNILSSYAPSVEQYSIDEAFCDMSGTASLYGDPVDFAHRLKDEIKARLGFTVNIGVSSGRLLAKMASDFQKPDMVHTLFPEEISEKMWPLPIESLFFVGRSTAAKLRSMGITTIGELAHTDRSILTAHLKKHGELIWKYANGIDVSELMEKHQKPKGYGNSVTLSHDVTDAREAHMVLLSLCETVAARLRADGARITLVQVQLTDCEFEHHSRQMPLPTATNSTQTLYDAACRLFDALWDGTPIRLLGVSTGKIADSDDYQLDLFDNGRREKLQKLDSALDNVRSKFGDDAVKRACFLEAPESRPYEKGGLSKAKFDAKKNPGTP